MTVDKKYARWTDEQDALGRRLMDEGKSLDEISGALQRPRHAIRHRYYNVWGGTIKRVADYLSPRMFFDVITPISSYILGFILTDGHLTKSGNSAIIVQSHSYGREHLEKIQKLTGGVLKGPNKNDAYRLAINCKEFCDGLINVYEIPKGKKSKIVGWPSRLDPSMFSHFVRGVFDGDGCILVESGGVDLHVSIASGSQLFIDQFKVKVSDVLGVVGRSSPRPTGSIDLTYTVEESLVLLTWMYKDKDASLYLDRKWLLYESAVCGRASWSADQKVKSGARRTPLGQAPTSLDHIPVIKHWTAVELNMLKELLSSDAELEVIALQLGRTREAVRLKAKSLGLRCSDRLGWSAEDDAVLKNEYVSSPTIEALAAKLNRTPISVKIRASKFGIQRTRVRPQSFHGTSEGAKKAWENPARRESVSKKMTEYWSKKENRKAQVDRMRLLSGTALDVAPPEPVMVKPVSFSALSVSKIDADVTNSFLCKYHYLGSLGRGGLCVGCFLKEADVAFLVAVAVYSCPVRQTVAPSLGLTNDEVKELSRLAVHPEYQVRNLGSWFLSRTINIVRDAFPSVKLLVSYADNTYGHSGAVYKASNWREDAVIPPDYWYVDAEGSDVGKRVIYDDAVKAGLTESEFVARYGLRKVYGLEKKRFILRL